MRIISRKPLRDFAKQYPDAKTPLDDWFQMVRGAEWNSHQELKDHIRTVSIVQECVVFNVGGNKYRLVVWINYRFQVVYVKAGYTHKEYDEVVLDCRKA